MNFEDLKKQQGVTMIEMMIVILVIAALAAVLLSVINPTASQGRARDGVRLNNIKNISEGIESYRHIEGEYPEDTDPNNPDSVLMVTYIREWPEPVADDGTLDPANFTYHYAQAGSGFVMYTNSHGNCYKYQTDWNQVLECPVAECSDAISLASDCN